MTDGLDKRGRLIMRFGEGAVRQAEMNVVIQLLIANGVVKPGEFADLVEKAAQRADDNRRLAAGAE